jgi:hypothetical protein
VLPFALAAAALLAAGCASQALEDERSVQGSQGAPPVAVEGGGEPVDDTGELPFRRTQPASRRFPDRCVPGSEERLGTGRAAYAARARGTVAALHRPGGHRLRVFEPKNANGVRTVFGILAAVLDRECRPAWYRVQLPIRPNGATGWVRADRVRLVRIQMLEQGLRIFTAGVQ